MKKTMTRLLALVLVALMAASFAACGKTPETETTAAPNTTAADVETTAAAVPADDTTAAETEAIVTEAPATEAPATEAPTTEAPTTAAPTTTEKPTETTTKETTTEKKAPTDKAEILKLYNDATAKVASKKPAFSKRRQTAEGVYDAGVALKAVKGVVYKFMGIGDENAYVKDVPKNDGEYSHYFQKSTLTTSDIKDASCTLNSDGSYDVTIKVKDGYSYTEGGSGDKYFAPLDKSGISAGKGDKGYWDHKTAQNVYAAISEVASGAVIDEK